MPTSRKLPFLQIVIASLALAIVLVSVVSAGGPNAHPNTHPNAQERKPVTAGSQAPPLYLGIDSYGHWDKLSYLEIGDRIWGSLRPTPMVPTPITAT